MSAPHPSTFIAEEIVARGWSVRDLAGQMTVDPAVNLMLLDNYFSIGPTAPHMLLASRVYLAGAVLGIDPDALDALERAWLATARFCGTCRHWAGPTSVGDEVRRLRALVEWQPIGPGPGDAA